MTRARLSGVAAALLGLAFPAIAARVAAVSPQGEVAVVRQVVVRFDAPVVPAGDPRAKAPFDLACNGTAPRGSARWLDDRRWAFDLEAPLPAGQRCTLKLASGFAPTTGTLEGGTEFSFATGAPAVMEVEPYNGGTIDEDQHFLLRLNGPVDAASVSANSWCETDGLLDRIPVRVVDGAAREAVLKRHGRRRDGSETALLLACQRAFAPAAKVRLVWGAGIAAAGQPALVTRHAQRFGWTVRERFLAEFSCERENAQSPCLPLRPLTLRFNAPVPRALAMAARLQPEKGEAIAPTPDRGERQAQLNEIRFAAPLPENTKFKLVLPAGLKDDSGRALANAATFPLAVATGGMPPLAKFAGAPFGIVEAGPEAMMPLTLRQVQADLAGASTSGQVVTKRLDASSSDLDLLTWLGRLRKDHDQQWETRGVALLAGEPGVRRAELPQFKDLAPGKPVQATEVIGIPLPQRGLHLIEVSSRILGESLLATKAPMYARTAALVTNLGVHFKRGRTSSLVWVTTLDRGRPVPNARVTVNDCRGQPLWQGSTDAAGMARIERGFEVSWNRDDCISREGLFVTARATAKDGDDLAFVFSDWARGIEPWRFNMPSSRAGKPDERAHTVFDRTLLRAGETVAMKHFVRTETERGLAMPAPEALPTQVRIVHVGSDTEYRVALAWPRGARSAESSFAIPKTAPLGKYEVQLRRPGERGPGLDVGSFRVEAFRVPLVDARLSGPAGTPVAPAEIAFNAQLNAMAGGPMADAPLKLSAVLRRAQAQFTGYDDFGFDPPQTARSRDIDEDGSAEAQTLVADKLAARTDKAGAAKIVVSKLPALQVPSDLIAELSFNDANGEVQTVAQRLRLWPAGLVVGLRVPEWTASRGDAGLTAVVLGTDGKPLAGRAVEVIGRLHQTLSTRKRIVGGFYAYDNSDEVKELGSLCSGKSDAQGRLNCSVKLDAVGEVELIARAKDDAGRAAEASRSVWVAGEGEWWFAQDNDDRIDVLPESRDVQPGGTAKLQVRMPFRQATALVTVEREGVIDARVVQLSVKEPVIELPIPSAAAGARSWAPNVVVGVFVLRGRVREAPWWSFFTWGWREPGDWWRAFRYEGQDYKAPTAMVDLAKPSFKFGATTLNVGLADHRLDVKVTPEKPQYGVRETVKTLVQVSQGGKPVANTEIAFAAVDEGLLALQVNASWKLLEGLFQPRPWGVETATAQGEIIGRRHYGRKALPPGGGGGRNPTRELFDTLLLWKGTVALDANGQARIDVPLNDSLTSFRLVAIADAGADRYGTGSASVRVSQDLQMLPGLPPLAREGDRFDATFTLRNTTARSMSVKATLVGKPVGEGAGKPIELPAQTVTLAAGAASEVRWSVDVPTGLTRIDWEGEAVESGGTAPARDRLKIAQAVQGAVPARVWQAVLMPLGGPLDGNVNVLVARPADAVPGVGGIVAGLQPRLTGALPGLRRYFETYPYSCLEQKTSRALGLRDQPGWARLRDELAGYLDSDGLAAYYPPYAGNAPRGSDRLTAYLLAAAHEAGWAWPDAQKEQMLQGLTAFVEGRIERRFHAPRADLDARKLAALEALSRHGRVNARMLGSISWAPGAWPTSALLDAWGLYGRSAELPERAARLDELQRLVRSRMVTGGTTLKFSTEAEDDWWWLMDGPDANAARLVLAALENPAWKGELPQIVNGALARQKRGAWMTTTANLWGVLALEKFGAAFERGPVAGRSTVALAGATRTHDWAAAAQGGTLNLPWPTAGEAPFTAKHEGTGKPWLTMQTVAAVPLKAPLSAGYRITRTVQAIERKQPDVWSRGDVMRVRIEIDALGDMSQVVVSDPVPAGATLLGSGLGRDSSIATQGEKREGRAWPTHEERAFDAWRGYYEWMGRGRTVVEYTLRLNTAGRFGLPPTRVEAMYAPETFGEWPNPALEVKP